ncbi:MAG: ABC transporter permease [Bacteroidales bacterium]
MNKTGIIIRREYLSRVRKKSFIVMTLLGPLLMAALIIGPVLIAQFSGGEYEVAVIDDTGLFIPQFKDANNVTFTHLPVDVDTGVEILQSGKFNALLHIPDVAFEAPSSLRLFSQKSVNLDAKLYIESILKNEFETLKLAYRGIDPEVLKAVETPVNIQAIKLMTDGEERTDYPEVAMGLGLVGGLLIYIFIFIFGSQVLRGVLEEKTSRIVEIIVSSVKPFQLMMGKIMGVALVGLTQFLIWIVLTFVIIGAFQLAFPESFQSGTGQEIYLSNGQSLNSGPTAQMETIQQQSTTTGQIMQALSSINIGVMLVSFLFYFLGGYLLYAALFAAIGSAVDSEADTQQFMLPVTIPLLFSFIMAQMVMQNPGGPVAFWLSIIPLTSPVIMMARIPFGVPYWELALSAGLLVMGFIFTTWLAAKIYRTGILMYGTKISYAILWKWIRYR